MKKMFAPLLAALCMLSSGLVSAANPQVEMETSMGTVIIELYPDQAPLTVQNFLRYVDDGAYDGTIFHRVIKGFMNQGGGFTPDLQQRQPSYPPVENEADNGLKNQYGTIAMARTNAPHSATSQFFINTADNDFLNFQSKSAQGWGYTVFGKVIDGMEVMDSIAKVKTGPRGPFRTDVPVTDIVIEHVKRLNDDAASSAR